MTLFSADEVKSSLDRGLAGKLAITVKAVTGSTNDDIRQLAAAGAPEGAVVIAGEQTAGRGRNGHSFYSPADAGLYMSVLLRPASSAADALAVTTMSGVAAASAIEEVCGADAGIKWVNDIYIGGRKVCGILAESVLSPDGSVNCTVVGIGINVADKGFPEDIRMKAGALGADIGIRARLAAAVLTNLFGLYGKLPSKAYMEEYRRRSVLTGRTVEYERGGRTFSARVVGIDNDARLLVEGGDGNITALSTGEVTMHKLN